MVARKRQYTQTDTGAWAADSGGINVALERNGVLTRIDMTFELTPTGTLDGDCAFDGLLRAFNNVTIRGGSHTYCSLPVADPCGGAILQRYLNRVDFRMGGHPLGLISAPRRTYTPITMRWHFGARPQSLWGRDNPFDLSAFIPAHKESQLQFIIATSGGDVVDASNTIASGTYRLTLHVVQGTPQELLQEMALQQVRYPQGAQGMIPANTHELFSHTATGSDYSIERDIPTGGYLKRIAIIEQDETATRALRAADQVTGVALKLPAQSEALIRSFADSYFNSLDFGSNSQTDDAAPDFQAHAPHGIIVMDMRNYAEGHGDYGLNFMAIPSGSQPKLGFTITTYTAGDASLILYERYQPNHLGF